MKFLKNNIDHYMRQKEIKNYSVLLRNIAYELGYKKSEAYEFSRREKSNFSKMLKEKRPLKHDFIIPLEKIFGVSLARLQNEDAYKLPVEKDNVPFDKGFRYYAYLDDPKLYRKEFDRILTKRGKSILTQTDEFEKNFLDYVVEYGSVNAVRYLHEEYGIKLKWYNNNFEFTKDSGITSIDFDNILDFARLVAHMNDAELFNDIYDSYNMFLAFGSYDIENAVFGQDEFLEIILDNDNLFNSLFKTRKYRFDLSSFLKRKKQIEFITYESINPIINNCLRYALKHLDKYRQRAIYILDFGKRHNSEIISKNGTNTYCICNDLGGLTVKDSEKKYYFCDAVDIAIFVDCEVNDTEIKHLVEQLPRFA